MLLSTFLTSLKDDSSFDVTYFFFIFDISFKDGKETPSTLSDVVHCMKIRVINKVKMVVLVVFSILVGWCCGRWGCSMVCCEKVLVE